METWTIAKIWERLSGQKAPEVTEDKHSNAQVGDIHQWADGSFHTKTATGWRPATKTEIENTAKPSRTYNKEQKHKDREKERRSKKTATLNSSDFGKTLKLSEWGPKEEVEKMAEPIRHASSWEDVEKILNSLPETKIKSKSGIVANISKTKIRKFLSGKASLKSSSLKAHYEALANVDHLFKNAIEPRAPEKNKSKNGKMPSPDIKWYHRLYAPLKYNNKIIPVKLTVREYRSPTQENKIYTLEALDVEL